MASVFPRLRPIRSDNVSGAEIDVLEELSKLPDDWIVLHSLWLKSHAVKLHAEADFVIIGDAAVLIVEVKGGQVWRDQEGVWHFKTNDGRREDEKREGPLDQARGAYYAIRNHFEALGRRELFDGFVWGYCAILPDTCLKPDPNDTAIDPELVLDNVGFPSQLQPFLAKVANYWTERCTGTTHHPKRTPGAVRRAIPVASRRFIADHLRPEFERVLGVGASVASSEQQLISLTDTQLSALDFASAEPRNILIGAAGTGKTVLAVEQARRMSLSGKRVLFVCFNTLLASRVRADLQAKGSGTVVALNYHQLALQLAEQFGRSLSFRDSWDDFKAELDATIIELVAEIRDRDRFDYLVIDEAQDMMSRQFMELLGCLLRNGLTAGEWLIAIDTQQAIFRSQFEEETYQWICSLGRKTKLELNCRNTLPIAAHVRALSGIGSVSTKGAEGEWPVIRYYGDRVEYLKLLKKVVNELISGFADAGIPASEITILTSDLGFIPDEVLAPGFFLRQVKRVDAGGGDENSVRFGSIQQFKGLEAKAIVICGIQQFDSESSRDLFYVGASRAKAALRVLLPKTCEQINRAMPEIIRFMGAAGEIPPAAEP